MSMKIYKSTSISKSRYEASRLQLHSLPKRRDSLEAGSILSVLSFVGFLGARSQFWTKIGSTALEILKIILELIDDRADIQRRNDPLSIIPACNHEISILHNRGGSWRSRSLKSVQPFPIAIKH